MFFVKPHYELNNRCINLFEHYDKINKPYDDFMMNIINGIRDEIDILEKKYGFNFRDDEVSDEESEDEE